MTSHCNSVFYKFSNFFKNLIYSSQELRVTNQIFTDRQFTIDNEPEYFIIGDDAVAELYTDSDFDFLKDYNQTVVKSGVIDKNTKIIFRSNCCKVTIGIEIAIETFELNENK